MKLAFIIFCISLITNSNLAAAKVHFSKHSLLEKSQQYLITDIIEQNCGEIYEQDLLIENERREFDGAQLNYSATIEGESQDGEVRWKLELLIKDLYDVENRDVYLRSYLDC